MHVVFHLRLRAYCCDTLGDITMMDQKLFQDSFHTHVESPPYSRSVLSIIILQVAKEHSEKMVKEAERKYMDRRRYLQENEQ